MNKVFAVARNTFREAIRNKILYAIVFFAILILFASLALGELSLGENFKVTKDLGLTAISFFGLLIAIFIGVSLVHKELDKRTIYTMISKPIYRSQFIFGKYIGMLLTALVQVLILSVVFTFLIWYQEGRLYSHLFAAIYLYWLEIMLITSVALFFSSFTTPFFSGLFTFSVLIIGRLMNDIELILQQLEHPVIWFFLKLSTVLPDLEKFNIGSRIVHMLHTEPVPTTWLITSTFYAISYIVIFLVLGMILFSRRDFT